LSTTADIDCLSPHLRNPGINDVGDTAAAVIGINVDGVCRAVLGTGAALHAAVIIDYFGLLGVHRKHPVWADRFTGTATNTFFPVIFEDGGAINVTKFLHCLLLPEPVTKIVVKSVN